MKKSSPITFIIFSFLILFLSGCSDEASSDTQILSADLLADPAYYAQVDVRSTWQNKTKNTQLLEGFFENVCPSEKLVLDQLYPLTNIADDADEIFFISEFLESKGFVMINENRGNWQNGPRVISLDLEKEGCTCRAEKRYYSARADDQHFATEEVKCESLI